MAHYLLIYEVSDDYLARRAEFRKEHLTLAGHLPEGLTLIAGGAVEDPTDMAILFFEAESEEPIKQFVSSDPYVQNGLVVKWRIAKWNTVAGSAASNFVDPQTL